MSDPRLPESPPAPVFFAAEHAREYDERNRKLAPIAENLHFLLGLVLEDLPPTARVLSVGAGTGAEILALARAFPSWRFVAVDPSRPMLDVCRERLESAGVLDRCELVHGVAQDLPADLELDAALALFVAHFVEREARDAFFRAMTDRVREGGYVVNAEISFDLDAEGFPSMLRNWGSLRRLMGATPESLADLPRMLREVLTVLAPEETEALLREAGVPQPLRFFQSFMVHGWYGVKRAPA